MKTKLLFLFSLICFTLSEASSQNLLGTTWKLTGEKVADLSSYGADSLRLEFFSPHQVNLVYHTKAGDSTLALLWWQDDTNRFFMRDSVLSFAGVGCSVHDTSTVLYTIAHDTMIFVGFADSCVSREEFFYNTKWALDGILSSLPYEFNAIGIHFYPNPVSEKIFFNAPDAYPDLLFVLTNMLGQKIPMAVNGNYIDVARLTDGLYYLRVFDKEMKLLYAIKKIHKQSQTY